MSKTVKGARIVVSFELVDVRKSNGLYVPELTVEELLTAVREYTRSACGRTGNYDEDISNPFLCVVDFAVARAAEKAISALFAQQEGAIEELGRKVEDLQGRLVNQEAQVRALKESIPGEDDGD
ncbi:hypothetical protein HY415_00345 [Candidatus Kaiserbacteria bacterium]|nr:hypothetical protein [Candidatus Kaiserbacteria bacterium]